MKRIAQGQSFRNIRDRGSVYIDKTREISLLISKGSRLFISRPRRFGKSLMLDTIRTLFESGTEQYFRDTWIYGRWEENKYPVLMLSFLDLGFTLESFRRRLCLVLKIFAERLHLDAFHEGMSAGESLTSLFSALGKSGRHIVILIDEYDCQLCACRSDPESYERFRKEISSLFEIMKRQECVRFLCVTGVTRLKETAVFSDEPEIRDVSYESDLACIAGFTPEETGKYYAEHISFAAALRKGMPGGPVSDEERGRLLQRLSAEYGGFCFGQTADRKVLSTWSVSRFFSEAMLRKEALFGHYWFESGGMPDFLRRYIENLAMEHGALPQDISVPADAFLSPTSLIGMNDGVLMCETGYLTLKYPIPAGSGCVMLGFPNDEIRRSAETKLRSEMIRRDRL